MTYSNRSAPSPWQHQTELNGEMNKMVIFDKINPYVFGKFSMPGTWSDPYAYAKAPAAKPNSDVSSPPPCAVEASCDTSKSPICDVAIAAGDGTVGMCRPTEPNCPMSRPWVPERNIDPGMWHYQQQPTTIDTPMSIEFIIKELKLNLPLVALCLVVIILFIGGRINLFGKK